MKTAGWIVVALVVIAAGTWMAKGYQAKEVNGGEKPVVKIGVASPLSGMIHKEAEEMKKAMLYMVEQKNNPLIDYEIIFEDTAGQAPKGISAANKLIHIDKVNVLISHLSAVSKVISPLATQNNILHIGTVLDANLKDNPTSFTFWTGAGKKAEKYVEFLRKNNFNNVAVLVLNFATTEKLYEELEKIAQKEGIKLTKFEFLPKQKDYKLDLMRIKNGDFDQVTFLVYPPELEILYKQYQEMNISAPVSTIECFAVANNVAMFEDIPYVDTFPGNLNEIEKIRIGANTSGTYAFAQLHDILEMIDLIVSQFYKQHNRIPNGGEMTKLILDLKNFKGFSGEVTIGEDRVIQSGISVLYLKEGKPVIVEE